jgi:hypothetical protein
MLTLPSKLKSPSIHSPVWPILPKNISKSVLAVTPSPSKSVGHSVIGQSKGASTQK